MRKWFFVGIDCFQAFGVGENWILIFFLAYVVFLFLYYFQFWVSLVVCGCSFLFGRVLLRGGCVFCCSQGVFGVFKKVYILLLFQFCFVGQCGKVLSIPLFVCALSYFLCSCFFIYPFCVRSCSAIWCFFSLHNGNFFKCIGKCISNIYI